MTLTYEKLRRMQRQWDSKTRQVRALDETTAISHDLPKRENPYYRIYPVHPLVIWLRRWFPGIKPWVWVYAPKMEEQAFAIGGRLLMSPALMDHLKRAILT